MTSLADGSGTALNATEDFRKQQAVWREELKRAEERAQRFKNEVD